MDTGTHRHGKRNTTFQRQSCKFMRGRYGHMGACSFSMTAQGAVKHYGAFLLLRQDACCFYQCSEEVLSVYIRIAVEEETTRTA